MYLTRYSQVFLTERAKEEHIYVPVGLARLLQPPHQALSSWDEIAGR